MSGIFKILFDLQIKSHNQPLEDYLTEIYTYCLNQDGDMLNALLKEFNIVDRDIEDYSITTQLELKALPNHISDSRPDMALVSNNTTIFFENKINAQEGNQQLQRYAEHLNQKSSKNRILVYITRDFDPKDKKVILERCEDDIKFLQLRWYSIFRFLGKYKENPIVLELLKFMKQNKLAMNNQYSPIDILTMTNFSRVHKIMDETMFGETSILFEKVIGKKRTQDSTRLTQLENHDRYVYYAAYKNKLHIFLGYWMNSDNEKEYPEIGVELDISPNAEINSTLKKIFKEISDKYEKWKSHNLNDPKRWAIVFRKRSLQDFLSESDHVEGIKSYLKDVLGDLESLFNEYPELRE